MSAEAPNGGSMVDDLPYDTTHAQGVGGSLKDEPDDFQVEEIPAYEPTGEGEHLFLWIEKRDKSHEQMTWRVSRVLGIHAGDIGAAGVKDRRAVTRQYISVPARLESKVPEIEGDGIRVLRAMRHRNKLKRGHLRGNRFIILLRGVTPEGAARAAERVAVIRANGFPNYFGSQRFGTEGSTLSLGLDLLSGKQTPRDIPPSRRRFLLPLALSSVQSYLFNAYLAQRITDHSVRQVQPGDVMLVTASGGRFLVEDVAREQQRMIEREVVISGPLFGPNMLAPCGGPAAREAALLEAHGLATDAFEKFPRLTSGTRRALIEYAADLTAETCTDGLRVCCTLDSGVYATSMLRELQ
jgi:tRNA pseudouridine13 synthase